MTSGDRKLFLFVALGFALLFGAWSALFTIASRNRMADVPLAHKTASPPGSARIPSAPVQSTR